MISPAPTMVMSARGLDLAKALCRDVDDLEPDDFHVDDESSKHRITKKAIALCKTPCPIIHDCFNYGYANNLSGVYGGTTTTERETIRRRERKRRAAAL